MKTTNKKERSIDLIADFSIDPETNMFTEKFAVGWKMAVGKWFCPALDIKLTDRVINGKTEKVWTQGPFYNFKEGDILHDNRLAHEAEFWRDAVIHVQHSVQIEKALPVVYLDEKNGLDPGSVVFVYFVNPEGNRLQKEKEYTCTQNQFVDFLRYGILASGPGGKVKIDLLALEATGR